MGWTTPKTWVPGEIPGATDLNTHLRDNLNHLVSRPISSVALKTGSNYVVASSGSYVDLDSTNLALALVPASGRVEIGASFSWSGALLDDHIFVRIKVDDGLSYEYWGKVKSGNRSSIIAGVTNLNMMIDTLTPNVPHNFKLQIATAGTITFYRSADRPFRFWGKEA